MRRGNNWIVAPSSDSSRFVIANKTRKLGKECANLKICANLRSIKSHGRKVLRAKLTTMVKELSACFMMILCIRLNMSVS